MQADTPSKCRRIFLKINFRSEPETFGPIPACRNNHTTAVYGDKIYFHGGHDGNQWLDDLYVLNTSSLVWSKPKVSGQVSIVDG
jgi:hypothetical protein